MDIVYKKSAPVSFSQVDLHNEVSLSGIFQYFQDIAIEHADQYNTGTKIADELGETWVLNRIAIEVLQYPKYPDQLDFSTWSTGIKSFKGFRDLRIVANGELAVKASTLWLYINVANKSIARVPKETAASFPAGDEPAYFAELDRLRLAKPGPDAQQVEISLRYTDIDANNHINNTAFPAFVQTALHKLGENPKPKKIELQYLKEISPDLETITVFIEKQQNDTIFGIGNKDTLFAIGRCEW